MIRTLPGAKRANLTKNIPLLNFENRYVTNTGEIVWLAWTSMPLESEQLVYAIAKNITDKKRLEEDRNQLITKLTRINGELKQVNYTASHDLRTPVGNLLSVFSLIDTSKIHDEETLEFIDILRIASENLKSTLDSYVDILIQKEEINIKLESLDLDSSLQTVLRSLRGLISNSKAGIRVDFTKAKNVRFNKAYLESIYLNLISNAIKYAKPGSRPDISIYSKRLNGVTQLVFADKGIGFDMEQVKDKIFGFHQKFHEHADSKGIGLYLVHNHITSLGGGVSVDSKLDEGAEFTITFRE